jgi:hypothetical protein
MSNHVFKSLLESEAKKFRDSFSEDSERLFYDEASKKLRHSGEFGMYREVVCKQFLRYFTPRSLDIASGFVITPNDEISTQCDIIVFDLNNTPLIQTDDRQKFFPIETVITVGEVKSILTKGQLKSALIKLSHVKRLRNINEQSPTIRRINYTSPIGSHSADDLFTFLICKKLNFDLTNISDDMENIYDGISRRYWHNVIFSIEDGLIIYYDGKKFHPWPEASFNIENRAEPTSVLYNENTQVDEFANFKSFAREFFLATSNATIFYPEILHYLY